MDYTHAPGKFALWRGEGKEHRGAGCFNGNHAQKIKGEHTMSEPTTQSEERTTLVYDNDGLGRPPWAMSSPMLKEYYDTEWGLPIFDEAGLYERLSLESFQSGLSWAVVLKKREAFRAAFCNFDPDKVAQFGEADVERLLGDASIIRNETKIRAAINNAKATIALREEGGLAEFIWAYQPPENLYPHRDGRYSEKELRVQAHVPRTQEEGLSLRWTGYLFRPHGGHRHD